jgi:hypothetical protein
LSVTTKKVKKKTVTSYKPIRLTSALPASSPMASAVLHVPATTPSLAQTDRLQIIAADLTDALGRPLDGNDDAQPGGNYTATFSRSGVTAVRPLVRTEDGGLRAEANRSSRARIEARLVATVFEIHFGR